MVVWGSRYIYIDVLDKKLVLAIIVKLQGSIISSYLLLGFQKDSCDRLIHKHSFTTAKWPCVEPISGNSMKQLSDLPDWGPPGFPNPRCRIMGIHGMSLDPRIQIFMDLHFSSLDGAWWFQGFWTALRVHFLIRKTHMDVSPKKRWQLKSSWQKMPCALQAWSCGNVNVQFVGYSLCTSTYQITGILGCPWHLVLWIITPL